MSTVREILREIGELKDKEHVWLGVREFLEGFTPEGGVESLVTIDGADISLDTVLDVMADVDSECLGPIQARIREIEASKVEDEKATQKKAKPAKKTTARNGTKKRSGKKS